MGILSKGNASPDGFFYKRPPSLGWKGTPLLWMAIGAGALLVLQNYGDDSKAAENHKPKPTPSATSTPTPGPSPKESHR